MLQALCVLFDRVIFNRLKLWLGINDPQTAFQAGKATTHQLFTVRLMIEISKAILIHHYLLEFLTWRRHSTKCLDIYFSRSLLIKV